MQDAEKTKDEILKEDAEQWEANREQRVQSWRTFTMKKTKAIHKQKKQESKPQSKKLQKHFFEMRAAPVLPEARPETIQNNQSYGIMQGDSKFSKPMGL